VRPATPWPATWRCAQALSPLYRPRHPTSHSMADTVLSLSTEPAQSATSRTAGTLPATADGNADDVRRLTQGDPNAAHSRPPEQAQPPSHQP